MDRATCSAASAWCEFSPSLGPTATRLAGGQADVGSGPRSRISAQRGDRHHERRMDISLALALVSTSAIVAGVIFAGAQVRLARRQRAHEAQLILVASF